jgi:hypothetical protein
MRRFYRPCFLIPVLCVLTGGPQLTWAQTQAIWWLNEHRGLLRPQPQTAHKYRNTSSRSEDLSGMVKSLGGNDIHIAVIKEASREFEVDPIFIASVVSVESSFRPRVKSSIGAKGLMQIRSVVIETLGVTDPWNSYENIMAGTAYLRHCFERYAKHRHSTFLALAAYNIGPNKPGRLLRSPAAKRFVKKVLTIYNHYTAAPIPLKRELMVRLDRTRY